MTDDVNSGNWFPSAELRFVTRSLDPDGVPIHTRVILQQKWRAYPDNGSTTKDEWRDVPLVIEE